MLNQQAVLDTRKLMTGKDGRLFINIDGVDQFFAEVDSFQVQMSVTNTDYQPVGSILTFAVNTGVSFTLTFSEAVIRDDLIMAPLIKAIQNGKMPTYDFQGATERWDGGEQRIVFNRCTPDGTIDLMNLTPGEIIKRQHSYRINSIPNFLKELAEKQLSA